MQGTWTVLVCPEFFHLPEDLSGQAWEKEGLLEALG